MTYPCSSLFLAEALNRHNIICANETRIQTSCYCESFLEAGTISHQYKRTSPNKEQVFMNASCYGEILAFQKTSSWNVFMGKQEKWDPGIARFRCDSWDHTIIERQIRFEYMDGTNMNARVYKMSLLSFTGWDCKLIIGCVELFWNVSTIWYSYIRSTLSCTLENNPITVTMANCVDHT